MTSNISTFCLEEEVVTSKFNEITGLVFVVLTPSVGIISLAIYLAHFKRNMVKKRMFIPNLFFFFGCMFQVGWGVFEGIGREGFPCSLLFVLNISILFTHVGPGCIRLAAFYFRVQKNKQLSKASLSAIIGDREYYAGMSDLKSNNDSRIKSDEFDQSQSNISPDVQSTSRRSENVPYPSSFQYFLASPRFSHVMTLILAICTVAIILPLAYNTSDCSFPCDIDVMRFELVVFLSIVYCLIATFFMVKIRKEPDPLYIKFEAYMTFAVGMVCGITPSFIQFLNEKIFISPGPVSPLLLWLFGNIIYIIIIFLFPVYLARRERRNLNIAKNIAHEVGNLSLQAVLGSQTGRNFFQAFCAAEFSMENYMFFKSVEKWKRLFKNKNKKILEIERLANGILATYIEDGASLRINISSRVRANILAREAKSETMFDECLEEVFDLMENDTFQRFKQTPSYHSLLGIDARKNTEIINQL